MNNLRKDLVLWNQISDKIKSNLFDEDPNALNDNIRELFNKFSDLPADDAWKLVLKVYKKYKNDYRINMAFSIGIINNFNYLPNKKEAWYIFEQIPTNVDLILKKDTKYWLISQLQFNAETLPANNVWNFLKRSSEDDDAKIRGEAGYTLCEYIAESENFPKEDAWNYIKSLLRNPEKIVKERILTAFSDFYLGLPKDELWSLTLKLSKENSKRIRDNCLNVAIEKSKDQIKVKDYLNASITLELILKELNTCSRIGWTRFILVGILFAMGIFIVKDTWIFVLNDMPYLFIGIALLLLLFWKALKLKADKFIILIYLTIFGLPIFLLFPLPYVILNNIIPISPMIHNIIVFGLIPSLIIPLIIFGYTNVSIKLITKTPRYNLGYGLYNYYIGRNYVQKYIQSNNSKMKLKYLKKAINKFKKATKNYNKLLFGFKDELSLCPYCLNFYQGLNIYEDLLRKPKSSDIEDLEKKINQSILIMEETNRGSDRLNQLLKELLNVTTLLVELKEKRQNISDLDGIDRMVIDEEIKEKSNDIDKIIGKIDKFISNMEDQNLPLITEIMKEKRAELDYLSANLKKEGFTGFDKYYSREEYNLIGILLLSVSILLLIIGSFYSTLYLGIGVFLLVISSLIMAFVNIKKKN